MKKSEGSFLLAITLVPAEWLLSIAFFPNIRILYHSTRDYKMVYVLAASRSPGMNYGCPLHELGGWQRCCPVIKSLILFLPELMKMSSHDHLLTNTTNRLGASDEEKPFATPVCNKQILMPTPIHQLQELPFFAKREHFLNQQIAEAQ